MWENTKGMESIAPTMADDIQRAAKALLPYTRTGYGSMEPNYKKKIGKASISKTIWIELPSHRDILKYP